ncbi:MAG: nitroreductase family protein, partial [Hadesarchaea archaeon]|nr:nitroreductase family protein [Hadesarchaea archaeon]
MEVFEAIDGRRSVREFKLDPVDEDDLKKILDAGRMAPSAGNCQPTEFVVVKDQTIKQRLARAAYGQ